MPDRRDLSKVREVKLVRPDPARPRRIVWDTNRKGLGIDVNPGGKRTWVYQYRAADGTSRRLSLGSADALTPHQAGALYAAALAAVAAGRDPQAARHQDRRARLQHDAAAAPVVVTVADAARHHLDRLERDRSARHAAESRRLWAKHLAPALEAVPLAALDAARVRQVVDALADTPVLANRVVALLSAVVARAEKDGTWPVGVPNPCRRVDRHREGERARYLTAAEWARLATALGVLREELETTPDWDTRPAQVAALGLIMMTGARKSAVMHARWRDLDPTEAALAVDPPQKGVDTIVLGGAALAWLMTWRETLEGRRGRGAVAPSAYVFPGQQRAGRAAAPVASLDPAWVRLRHLADIQDIRVHDLRRSFAVVGVDLGLGDLIVGGLLGHRVAQGVTGVYARRSPQVLREAADLISQEVARRLSLGAEHP